MPITCHTTQATWIYAIYHALQHNGIDAEALFAEQGIQLCMFKDVQEDVPKKLVNALWQQAIETSGDDAFCLSVIDFFNTPYIDSLASSAKACKNMLQALEILSSYYKLISPEIELSVRLDDEIQIEITHKQVELEGEWLPDDVDITLALIKKHSFSLPENELKPSRLLLARPKLRQHKKYEDFFCCPVEFNAEKSMICFPLEILEYSIPSADPDQWIQLEKTLIEKHEMQFNHKPEQAFNLRVRRYLFENLGQNFPNLNTTASHFHMSISAFKKHLQDEKCHFQLLSDEVRRNEACRLINLNILPLKQIAYRLGFATNSVFNRAFKRWMQLSPSEYFSSKHPTGAETENNKITEEAEIDSEITV